ncbi:MAG TPA: DUF4238 domain-containing protein [Clostridiaceae bacterium]
MIKNKQHYIPQMYLKNFTDPQTPPCQMPYVWIFDKKNYSIKNKSTKNFANEKGFNNIIDNDGNVSTIIKDEFQKIEDIVTCPQNDNAEHYNWKTQCLCT